MYSEIKTTSPLLMAETVVVWLLLTQRLHPLDKEYEDEEKENEKVVKKQKNSNRDWSSFYSVTELWQV